jgi:acyl carrier protein phosphodiesterase
MTEALRGLDRTAANSLRHDRAKLSSVMLEVFAEHLSMKEWNETDEAVKDTLERWRIGVGERAGLTLPKASPTDLPLPTFRAEGA